MQETTLIKSNRQLRHEEQNSPHSKFPLSVLLDNITVPENVGSVFRLCDALGVSKLYLAGTTPAPPNRRLAKLARSTEKIVEHIVTPDPVEVLQTLRARRVTIVSLEITTASVDIELVDFTGCKEICLVIGAENYGVQPAILALSDHTVHIPMLGVNSSMNVATAAAIATYVLVRRLGNPARYSESVNA